jgi:hypothetical protein
MLVFFLFLLSITPTFIIEPKKNGSELSLGAILFIVFEISLEVNLKLKFHGLAKESFRSLGLSYLLS